MGKDNRSKYVILGLLSHEEMTGYDIKKRVDASIGFFWSVEFGQIYPTLKVLEESGLVTKRDDVENGRSKIVYKITENGRKELTSWLKVPAEKEYLKFEVLIKLFFGAKISKEENIKHIEEFKERNRDSYNILSEYKQYMPKIFDQSPDHLYYYLTILLGEKIYKSYMEWAEEAEKLLQEYDNNIKER